MLQFECKLHYFHFQMNISLIQLLPYLSQSNNFMFQQTMEQLFFFLWQPAWSAFHLIWPNIHWSVVWECAASVDREICGVPVPLLVETRDITILLFKCPCLKMYCLSHPYSLPHALSDTHALVLDMCTPVHLCRICYAG